MHCCYKLFSLQTCKMPTVHNNKNDILSSNQKLKLIRI